MFLQYIRRCHKHHLQPTERKVTYYAFIEPAMWPANSPDLNLVDYAVLGVLQQYSLI